MKLPIAIDDIRKGDLIRWEDGENAYEWRVQYDRSRYNATKGQHYILDRPEETPFEPKVGMVITSNSKAPYHVGVKIDGAWLGFDPGDQLQHWFSDDWAEEKMKQGWVEISLKEGVKR